MSTIAAAAVVAVACLAFQPLELARPSKVPVKGVFKWFLIFLLNLNSSLGSWARAPSSWCKISARVVEMLTSHQKNIWKWIWQGSKKMGLQFSFWIPFLVLPTIIKMAKSNEVQILPCNGPLVITDDDDYLPVWSFARSPPPPPPPPRHKSLVPKRNTSCPDHNYEFSWGTLINDQWS